MSNPAISVIVPVYRVERYLKRCVESILNQTFSDFELLLIDDGSPDRSGAMCDEWALKEGRVRVLHTENRGLSAARNLGIGMSRGRYLSFVDSDDYIMPRYLEELFHALDENPGAGYSECSICIMRNGRIFEQDNSGAKKTYSALKAFADVLYGEKLSVAAWGKLFRRKLFDGLRFPEGRRFEDVYIIGELLRASSGVAYRGLPLYRYVLRSSSLTTGAAAAGYATLRQHYEAANRFADIAVAFDPSLEDAARRFRAYGAMRMLRHYRKGDFPRSEADGFRREVLARAEILLRDGRIARRDRMGIRLLRLGLLPYLAGWNVYEKLRDVFGGAPAKEVES